MEHLIRSLQIRNFRMFRELDIPRLGALNLLVGRNNTGKSSVLEAVALLATLGSLRTVREILSRREETAEHLPPGFSLLHRGFEPLGFHLSDGDRQVAARFGLYRWDVEQLTFKPVVPNESDDASTFIEVSSGRHRLVLDNSLFRSSARERSDPAGALPCVVVPTAGLTQPELAQYWSRIATTDFEDRINSQLQSCFPEIQRVSVVPAGAENATIARVRGTPRQVSLKSLGEGACRFFGLALAASSASGGVLLIDEVEIGIHYSVQLELWRFLGHMAREFRVQIFATTHSEDAVRAFGVVAAELPEADGQLIRLQSRSGAIEAVVFDSEDLACARETGHEVR